jgi:hypothetical protein
MHSGREEFCLVTGCGTNRRILSSLARARPNGRVERFCCVQKLHFDEHYIMAKNGSFRDSELARLGQIDQCTVVDSMESSKVMVHKLTNSPWILVTRLWNQYVICSLCLFLSLCVCLWLYIESICILFAQGFLLLNLYGSFSIFRSTPWLSQCHRAPCLCVGTTNDCAIEPAIVCLPLTHTLFFLSFSFCRLQRFCTAWTSFNTIPTKPLIVWFSLFLSLLAPFSHPVDSKLLE